jgi:hypothetical protein
MSQTFHIHDKHKFNADVSLNGTNTVTGLTTFAANTGKVQFNADVSFNNATTEFNTSLVDINSGSLNIDTLPKNFTLQSSALTSGVASGYFGNSVSVSQDGNTLAIGSIGESNYAGAVYVYTRSGTTWNFQQTLTGDGGNFGYSVSLSFDGNTLSVGSPAESSTGSVRVYKRTVGGTTWNFQQSLTNGIIESQFGNSVSLSSDGNTLAIGSVAENDGNGAVRIYTRSGTTWNFQQTLSTGVAYGNFGWSTYLSYDGNTLAVGSQNESSNAGAVRVYTRSVTTWSLQKTLTTDVAGDSFGYSISLSSDGNILAVGSQGESSNAGRVRVYTRPIGGTTWSLQQTLTPDVANGQFGSSLSLSSDGNTIAVGSVYEYSYTGRVRVYTRPIGGTTWSLQQSFTTSISEGQFGSSVSISQDGNTIAVGSLGESSSAGAVRVYVNLNGNITIGCDVINMNSGITNINNASTQINSSSLVDINSGAVSIDTFQGSMLTSGVASGKFGWSTYLSSDGYTLAIGAYTESSNAGAVYVYTRSGTTWYLQQKLTGNGGEFGYSVSLSSDGNTLAVGAYVESNYAGAVRVYIRSGTTWSLQTTTELTSNVSNGYFGNSVSLSSDGNTLAVGAYVESNYAGAVRVYTRSGTTWSLQTTTELTSGVAGGRFGYSVSISSDGNTLAVGSTYESSYAGRVRVYTRSGTAWSLQTSPALTSGVVAVSQFGNSVSLSSDGNTLAVGAYAETDYAGAVRVYTRSGTTWTLQTTTALTSGVVGDYFGYSVYLSSDGYTLAVGSPSYDAVRVYTRSGTTWSLQKILKSGVSSSSFGVSVSVSSDGNILAVGSHFESSNAGAVRVYLNVNGTITMSGNLNIMNGNVGIGTTNPTTKMQVASALSTTLNTNFATNSDAYWTNNWGLSIINDFTNNNKLNANSTTRPALGLGLSTGLYPTAYITSLTPHGDNGWNPLMIDGGKVCFNTNSFGNVGIATSSPAYPLDIGGSAGDTTYPGYTVYTYTGTEGNNNLQTSIRVVGGIMASQFVANSDSRIKNNIIDIDDEKALQTLRLIKPKTYNYVDKIQRGNRNVIGFIAQEIKEIIPNAITISKYYVPNFYTLCQVAATDSSNILLVTSPIDLSWNPLHDQSGNAFVDADGNACSDASGNKVFNVKLYDQSNNEIECKTTNVLDKRSFLVDIADKKLSVGEYFLYGQEVDDFHNIDKSAIFTVVTAAVQDIDRKQVLDEAKIEAQDLRISELESKNASLEARLAAIEQMLSK